MSELDAQLAEAVERAVGHPPPFADGELTRLQGPLVVARATELGPLARMAALTELTLYGCESGPVPLLNGLSSLRRLRVLGCAVDSLDFVRGCPALERLEVNFTHVTDLAPLLELPVLRYASFIGNPLHAARLADVSAKLARLPRGGGRPPILELPSDEERRIQQTLVDRNLRLGYGNVDWRNPGALLVRPGIGRALLRDTNQKYKAEDEVDYVETSSLAMKVYFERNAVGVSSDAFFAATFMDRPPIDRGPSRLATHIELGDAEDARSWIAAVPLPDPERAALQRFVARFPSLRFYREDAAMMVRLQSQTGARLPTWLAALRSRAVALVEPRQRVRLRFDGFDVPHSPRAEYARDIWYEPTLRPLPDPDVRKIYADSGAFPIAEWRDEMRSTLLVSLDERDGRIFECAQADLFDRRADGEDPAGSIYAAFESYASMLGHIVAVELDGNVVAARPA
jgi:hypothetical protein